MKPNAGEDSPADTAQDMRDAKRAGKTQAQYEGSPEDERKDAAREKRAAPMRARNPHGNPGHHPSTRGYEHSGSVHSSKDR